MKARLASLALLPLALATGAAQAQVSALAGRLALGAENLSDRIGQRYFAHAGTGDMQRV